MYMYLSIAYPSWLHPEIFPGLPVLGIIRWYSLMYIVAFSTAFWLLKKVMHEGMLNTENFTCKEDDIFNFIATGIVFLLLGARIFSALVYDTSGIYWQKPWLIFWPFNENGQFSGLAGMSYHGGFIGGFIGMAVWCAKNKKPLFKWIDAMACALPLGYTFGRVGNFCNAELYGRITTAPWGIIFPGAEKFSKSLPWVSEFIAKCSMDIETLPNLVNLPRHPSQLYEAFFEGLVLWLIIWFLRKKKPFDGFLTSIYITGYGIFRFFIEYFREPDADIGYRIAQTADAPLYMNTSLLNISTGQILCFLMIVGGTMLGIACCLKSKKMQQTR